MKSGGKRESSISADILYFPTSRRVIIPYGSHLCTCKVKVVNGTLAESLGSLADESTEQNYLLPSLCVDAAFSVEVANRTKKTKKFMTGNRKQELIEQNKSELAVLDILVNRELTPTENDFMTVFMPYVKSHTQRRSKIRNPLLARDQSAKNSFVAFSELVRLFRTILNRKLILIDYRIMK